MAEPGPLHQRTLLLPPDLLAAIEAALHAVPAERWIREAQALSERYRGPRATQRPLASGTPQVLGYAAMILPATYAQLRGACAATAARLPGWQPHTMLDLGSGPGTALWAASATWPTLQTCVAVEREAAFITLGRTLAQTSATPAIRAARWEQADLLGWRADPSQPYDVVVLGHVLNELSAAEQQAVVEQAWSLTGGVLLVVEPGTTEGFVVVRAARDRMLAHGAHTIAPCAHSQPCPLQNDWCHFPQRLKRPPFQRRARNAPSEWEDSKFSSAALARNAPTAPIWGRVIREPTSNKAYAETTISSVAGVARVQALKRNKDAFRRVRDLSWGDALDEPIQ